ncbi:glycerate kinase [Domibacillus antri]|uniref:Glycerate kinase n=1 Tax=Domibacillus antri TaxID=1714264 RepID=A0A1Q8Q2M7_9BACI|nr:glycerate kinase [Domibacillus antri]OLN21555.1 glycerate kinase [Domibacillus antri]
MKVLLCPDSFKGSLTASDAAKAMAAGISEYDHTIQTVLLPVADGGEGTVTSLVNATNGKIVRVSVQNPLGKKIMASYGVLGDGKTCVIEMAEASGLTLLREQERNPLLASTYGTGELIHHALDAGYRTFILGVGGSATNDGGAGMLQALGLKLLDDKGKEIAAGGQALQTLVRIDQSSFDPRIQESTFIIASDVDNPFIGPNGASAIFGPQKGATPEMVETLDQSLSHFADLIEQTTGLSIHDKPGAGAAGGIGGAFQSFFPAEMKQGIHVVLKAIHFEQHMKEADLVMTGEGKTDRQTLSGKAPYGIKEIAARHQVPVILISGAVEDKEFLRLHFNELHSVSGRGVSKKESMGQAYQYLKNKTKEVISAYLEN